MTDTIRDALQAAFPSEQIPATGAYERAVKDLPVTAGTVLDNIRRIDPDVQIGDRVLIVTDPKTLADSLTAVFLRDTFADTDGKLLTAHVGELNAQWLKSAGWNSDLVIAGGAVYGSGVTNYALQYATAVPTSPNYSMAADVRVKTLLSGSTVGVYARHTGASPNIGWYGLTLSTTTMALFYADVGGQQNLGLYTLTGSDVLAVGQLKQLAIKVQGTAISGYLNGAQKLSGTDGNLANAGRAAIRCRNSTATTGLVLEGVTATAL